MNDLQQIAFDLLDTDQVQMVIGYEVASEKKVRPAFIKKAKDAENLIFNNQCIQNLAVYITKKENKALSGIAIVASLPVMRSIVQLARESQLSEKQLKVIGISPAEKAHLLRNFSEVAEFVSHAEKDITEKYDDAIQKIKALPMEERWNYWMAELSDCFKCYACRAACPLCYCNKCIVETNQPQWIPASSQPLANLEWHINRAMHMAGRCTQCDACAEACPLGIPINLITRNMISDYEEAFGPLKEHIGVPNLLSSYNTSDRENFIR
jgi:ferredoxin